MKFWSVLLLVLAFAPIVSIVMGTLAFVWVQCISDIIKYLRTKLRPRRKNE